MILKGIVAVAPDGTIGKGGAIPWRAPADLRHFKDNTMGHPVVFGRKTYESLPGPLPGRDVFVLSRSKTWVDESSKGGVVLRDLGALVLYGDERSYKMLWVGGGAQLYRATWSLLQELLVTVVHVPAPDGDVRFPCLPSASLFRLEATVRREADEKNPPLTFQRYVRHTFDMSETVPTWTAAEWTAATDVLR